MGQYLPLIIAILVIIVIAFLIERRWRRGAEKEEAAEPAPEAKTGYVSKMTSGFKGLRDRVMPGRQPELATQFQAWADEALKDQKALKEWLTSFNAAESQSFTDQLAAFCADLNLDLGWLVQKKLDKDPDIEQAAKTVVLDYCQSCYQAAQAQADFKAFGTFQSMLQNPKGYRALSQRLFTELVNQKLAKPVTPDLFLAPEGERQSHMMDAISQAADKDRQKFITTLKQILAEQESAAGAKSGSWTEKITKPFKKADPVTEEGQPAEAAAA